MPNLAVPSSLLKEYESYTRRPLSGGNESLGIAENNALTTLTVSLVTPAQLVTLRPFQVLPSNNNYAPLASMEVHLDLRRNASFCLKQPSSSESRGRSRSNERARSTQPSPDHRASATPKRPLHNTEPTEDLQEHDLNLWMQWSTFTNCGTNW